MDQWIFFDLLRMQTYACAFKFKLAHPNLCLHTENWITLEGSRRKEDGIYGCWEGKLLTSCGHYTSKPCTYIKVISKFGFEVEHSNFLHILPKY